MLKCSDLHRLVSRVTLVVVIFAAVSSARANAIQSADSPTASKRAYKNFVRFGRGGSYPTPEHDVNFASPSADQLDNYLPYYGVEGADPAALYAVKRAYKNFLRFGRGYKNFVRFGRGGTKNFIRFGRSAMPLELNQPIQESSISEGSTSLQPQEEQQVSTRQKRAVPNLFALLNTAQSSPGWPEDDEGYDFGSNSFEDNPEEAILELQKRGFNKNFLRFGRDSAESGSSEEGLSGGILPEDRFDRTLRARNHKNFLRFG